MVWSNGPTFRITGEAPWIAGGAENGIAEAGSSGWLGERKMGRQSMEGMLHHRNKSVKASNTLTSFGQPYTPSKGLLAQALDRASIPESVDVSSSLDSNPLEALSAAA